jgi:(2Fe-2S) ferredoxin
MQKGAANVAGRLRIECKRRGLDRDVLVNTCDSIDLCDIGPNIVVYPERVIYSGVQLSDLKEIIAHLEGGPPVERLMLSRDTPAEAHRREFYEQATANGDTLPAEAFAALGLQFGFDDKWIAEQARRGFIARKERDGEPVVVVISKALQRYSIELPPAVE